MEPRCILQRPCSLEPDNVAAGGSGGPLISLNGISGIPGFVITQVGILTVQVVPTKPGCFQAVPQQEELLMVSLQPGCGPVQAHE